MCTLDMGTRNMPEQENTAINLCVSCPYVTATALHISPFVICLLQVLHINVIYFPVYSGIVVLLPTDLFFCGRKAASQTN